MMDEIQKIGGFDFTQRDAFGKKETKKLRDEGYIPVNLYSKHRKENIHGFIEQKITEKAYLEGCFLTRLFKIKDKKDGKSILAFAHDVSIHSVKSTILHIDFIVVTAEEEITRKVPIRVINKDKSPSIKLGGKLNFINRFVPVSTTVNKLPEILELSIEGANSGAMFKAKDLPQSEDYVLPNDELPLVSLIGKKGKAQTEES